MDIKIDAEGRRIFYPWAGGGRVIRTEGDISKISSLHAQIVLVSPLAVLIGKLWPSYALPLFGWAVFALIRYVRFIRSLPLANLPLSGEQLELESMRGTPKPILGIAFFISMSIGWTGYAIYEYAYKRAEPDMLLAMATVFSVFFLWVPWWVMKKWQRANNSLQARRP